MSFSKNISRVIKSARELKRIADELENIEIKSRLLDEIDQLQELRESLAESGELAQFSTQQVTSEPNSLPESASSDSAFHMINPDEKGETYDIHVDDGTADKAGAADATEKGGAPNPSEEQEDERFRLGETLLRKLEPQHQHLLKKMNDILTDEQKFRKQTLTREGQAAGKPPNQIQQEVMAALELTEKQLQLLATARKELHDIRAKIAREVDGLLTVEQRKRLQKRILKEISAGE